jgi:ribosome-associated toxin RatA of RatAB toxin-antitoxin module
VEQKKRRKRKKKLHIDVLIAEAHTAVREKTFSSRAFFLTYSYVSDVHARKPETIYVRADQKRLRTLSTRWKVARLSQQVTMIDFDPTLLALIGISGSTYLGFKLQEKQP